jgi:hypothetical protein
MLERNPTSAALDEVAKVGLPRMRFTKHWRVARRRGSLQER